MPDMAHMVIIVFFLLRIGEKVNFSKDDTF